MHYSTIGPPVFRSTLLTKSEAEIIGNIVGKCLRRGVGVAEVCNDIELAQLTELVLWNVRFASVSLGSSIMLRLQGKYMKPSNTARLERGFMKYLTRMSSRTALFGGMAFQGIVRTADAKTRSLSPSRDELFYVVTPSHKWVREFLSSLCSLEDIDNQTRLQASSLIYSVGNRIYVMAASSNAENEGSEPGYFTLNQVTAEILRRTREPILKGTLLGDLTQRFPQLPRTSFVDLVDEMIKKEVLVSSMVLNPMHGSPMRSLLRILGEHPGVPAYVQERLLKVASSANSISHSSVMHTFPKIDQLLSDLDGSLKLDAMSSTSNISLDREILHVATQTASILVNSGRSYDGNAALDTYRDLFVNRYGAEGSIGLLDLLNPHTGLGYPDGFPEGGDNNWNKVDRARHQSLIPNKRDSLLLSWAANATAAGCKEILLSDSELFTLTSFGEETRKPRTLDFLFSVHQFARQDEHDDFWIIPEISPGSSLAGRVLGRFLNDDKGYFKDSAKDIANANMRILDDHHICEVVVPPWNDVAGDLVFRSCVYPTSMDVAFVSTESSCSTKVPISEVKVSIRDGRFHFHTTNIRGPIIFTMTNRLNPRLAPAVIRFLLEASEERMGYFGPFDWGYANQLPFLPRIRYGRSVVSPAKWNLTKETLSWDGTPQKANDAIDRFIHRWKVPYSIGLVEGDTLLSLNLEADDDRDLLLKFVRSGNKSTLVELFDPDLQSQGAKSTPEAVESQRVSFLLPLGATDSNRSKDVASGDAGHSTTRAAPSEPERNVAPGGNCLYAKVYCSDMVMDQVISDYIPTLIVKIRQRNFGIDKWFFTRYADPEPHLRLRFFSAPNVLWSEFLPLFSSWFRELYELRITQRLVFDTYVPETARYGGPEYIGRAEEIFMFDSMDALDRLRAQHIDSVDERVVSAVTGLCGFMERLGFTKSSMEDSLHGLVGLYEVNEVLDSSSLKRKYHSSVNRLARLVGDSRSSNRQVVSMDQAALDSILPSLIHMHFNRHWGMNRNFEASIIWLAQQILKTLRYRRSNA